MSYAHPPAPPSWMVSCNAHLCEGRMERLVRPPAPNDVRHCLSWAPPNVGNWLKCPLGCGRERSILDIENPLKSATSFAVCGLTRHTPPLIIAVPQSDITAHMILADTIRASVRSRYRIELLALEEPENPFPVIFKRKLRGSIS